MKDVEAELADLGLPVLRCDNGANGREARCACPFCPARPDDARPSDSFSANLVSRVWHCHRCGEKGNMFTLRQRLRGSGAMVLPPKASAKTPPAKILSDATVARMEAALWGAEGDLALRYLRGTRKLADATIKHFRLGFVARQSGPAVAIPHFMGGLCVGVKYRLLSDAAPHKYDREAGCRMPLFGIDSLAGGYEKAILTEGEFDAITFAQWFGLDTPVCSLPDGATAALKDEARAALVSFTEILICTDTDAKGDEGAQKIAAALGAFRCRRVKLPMKDANDCLVGGVALDAIKAALAEAPSCYDTQVRHLSAWWDRLMTRSPEQARGISTGWASLDALLGGLRAGEVTLLTAGTGAGKTSFTIDMSRRQGMNGVPTLIASLEMNSDAVASRLLSAIAACRWDFLSPQQCELHRAVFCELPIYLVDRKGTLPIARFRAEVEFAVRRYGVRVAVLDHLHYALGSKRAGEDERAAIDAAALEVTEIASDLGVHVVLVMHPAKIRADDDGRTREPEIGDLKGSSGPSQLCDNVLRIARQEGGFAALKLLKVRAETAKLGGVALRFDEQTRRFEEVAPPVNGFKPAPAWRRGPND